MHGLFSEAFQYLPALIGFNTMELEKDTKSKRKSTDTKQALKDLQAENEKLKERVEELIKAREYELTPRTDTDLLRALYNWKAWLDKDTTEQFRAKNSEIEELKAEIYRLRKYYNDIAEEAQKKEEESEAEATAFNIYNLYAWLAIEAVKEKHELNLYSGNFKDYLTEAGVEPTSQNIAKIRALAKDMFILTRSDKEANGVERTYTLLQDLRLGKDFITVRFNDAIYANIQKHRIELTEAEKRKTA